MIDGAEALLALAQVAVALAGFMGVVMVFRGAGEALHPVDASRIQWGLLTTFGPVLLGLLPVGLGLVGVDPAQVWTACSIFGVASMIGLAWFERRKRAALPGVSIAVARFFQVLLAAAVVLFIANAMSTRPGPGLYFLALLQPLTIGGVAFWRIVFVRPADLAMRSEAES